MSTRPDNIDDDDSWTIIERLEPTYLPAETAAEDVPEDYETDDDGNFVVPGGSRDTLPVEEDASDVELFVPVDDSVLPDTKIDVDGNVVSQGERWGDETAFTLGGTDITKEQAATASGVMVALIIVVVLMCCFFSYIERKKIAAEGRRLSTVVRRASTKLRRGGKGDEEPAKDMTDKDIEKNASSAAGNKAEKNFL